MSKGFTLIEMLLVVVVVGILSGIFLLNYHSFGEDLKLQLSAHQLAQAIRSVSEMAMSAKDIGLTDVSGGYGIYIKKGQGASQQDQIIIFVDCNKDNNYKESVNCEGFSEKIEEINLEEGIKINSLTPPTTDDDLTIIFKPPNPKVIINSNPSINEAVVKINLESDGSKIKRIKVNKVGLIEIN